MDKNMFEGKWKEIRGKSKEWWSLINDIDLTRLDKAPRKFDKYVVLLQVKYGYTKQHARQEIDRRLAAHAAAENTVPTPEPGTPGVVAPGPETGRRGRQPRNVRAVKTLK
jgi:hypothetical protein